MMTDLQIIFHPYGLHYKTNFDIFQIFVEKILHSRPCLTGNISIFKTVLSNLSKKFNTLSLARRKAPKNFKTVLSNIVKRIIIDTFINL